MALQRRSWGRRRTISGICGHLIGEAQKIVSCVARSDPNFLCNSFPLVSGRPSFHSADQILPASRSLVRWDVLVMQPSKCIAIVPTYIREA